MNPPFLFRSINRRMPQGFSLVEVLAAIAIIGIVTFIAIPNLVRIKEDGELKLAISRVETLNIGVASYYQSRGKADAIAEWAGADAAGRYNLIAPYIAFAASSTATYMPSGYGFTLPTSLQPPFAPVTLTKSGTAYPY